MHLPKTTGINSHTPYGYIGYFIVDSREVMFWLDPSLKIVCTKFSFLGYIEKSFAAYMGSHLHRHRSRLSIWLLSM